MKKITMVIVFCFLLIGLVSAACAKDVTLEWDPVVHPDLAGYNVYQSEKAGNSSTSWALIGSTAQDVTVFTVSSIDELKTITWVVTAFSTQGEESGHSNPVTEIRTAPPAPQNVRKQ